MFNSDAVAGSRPDRAAHISGLFNTERSRYTLSSPGSGRLTGNERINQCQLELRSKQKPHPESTDARCALSGVPGNGKKNTLQSAAGGVREEEAVRIRGSYSLLSAAALRCPPEQLRTSTSFTLRKTHRNFGIPSWMKRTDLQSLSVGLRTPSRPPSPAHALIC